VSQKLFTHQRFEGKLGTDPKSGCTVWLGAKKEDGSGLFVVNTWKPRRCTSPQRYAFSFYVGPIPPNCYIKSKCGNPLCVTPTHLRARTRREAIQESIKAGRWTQGNLHNLPPVASGEKNPHAHYSDEFVRKLREERARGTKLAVLASRHKLPMSTTGFLCSKRKGV